MPHGFAIAEAAYRLPIDDDVRHHSEVWITGNPRLTLDVDRRLVEFAETRAEVEQLLFRQVLAPESQHVIGHPGFEDSFELSVAQRAGQIDACDVGSDRLPGRDDTQSRFAAGLFNGYEHGFDPPER